MPSTEQSAIPNDSPFLRNSVPPIGFGAFGSGYTGKMWKRVRSTFRWLGSGAVETVPRWWLRCPTCDAELVGPWNAGVGSSSPPRFPAAPPTSAELVAKCPMHGHAPYNDASKKPSVRRIADGDQRER